MNTVGNLLREWRGRRRLSQLDLALQAGISSRHLSFVETGRSVPSREVIVSLAEELQVPLREQNRLLVAAGYAPSYAQSMLDSPHMAKAREAVRRLLVAHEPFPAVAIDRQWNLLDANAGIALFTGEVERELLAQPVNVLRLSLHPNGLAPRIVNLFEWRAHLLARLKHDIALTADEALVALSRELESYPCPDAGPDDDDSGEFPVFVPLRIRHDGAELAFLSTVTKFGTARDVTIEEISIESFFPANDATKAALGRV